MYTGTVGCYCALVMLYILFPPFPYSIFIPSDFQCFTSAYYFLFFSVNQTACGVRDDTLFLYSRSASFRGTIRRFSNEESQSGISRRSTGVFWPPEKGTSRFDAECGSPAKRGKWKKEGRNDWHTDEVRETERTTEVLTDSLPSFLGC